MGVSSVWVKKVWRRYRVDNNSEKLPELRKPGRKALEPSEDEKKIIREAYEKYEVNALTLERVIDSEYHTHIPHNRIHCVLRNLGLALSEPRKQTRRKWIRYEREHSNSLWHTDWKFLEGRGWFTAYLDDASRYIVGYGLFPEATSEHSVEVLTSAITKNGKPASVLTDHGTQFYANEAEEKVKGLTEFEKYLITNEIRQILGRVMHPQTNGKIERFFRTVEEKLPRFKSLGDLIEWYNMRRPHMSLNLDVIETPYKAYLRKMPPEGIVTDEKSGEIYDAQKQ
ncbi:MAG: DDE-type integrase/transposase/recombinase [Thaumarchaeota archaeon]|nr:DDE-type integrase/transposase/recombinase [Nitrososphaerota archaeon]